MKNKNGFNAEFYTIINILMEWNPLGVEGPAFREEYIGYILKIMKLRKEPHELRGYCEKHLLGSLGVTYYSEIESETAIRELVDKY
jgi:hypothetical protein